MESSIRRRSSTTCAGSPRRGQSSERVGFPIRNRGARLQGEDLRAAERPSPPRPVVWKPAIFMDRKVEVQALDFNLQLCARVHKGIGRVRTSGTGSTDGRIMKRCVGSFLMTEDAGVIAV